MKKLLTKINDLVGGKRTHIVAATIAVCGVLTHYGVEIPEWIWPVLAAAGLSFLRAGVQKVVKLKD